MKFLGCALAAVSAVLCASAVSPAPAASSPVTLARIPQGGIQPEVAADARGVTHLLYFSGEPAAGNLFYVRSTSGGAAFTNAVRVNSQDGSAIATGTIRGGRLAIGRDGRVHVVWNGSNTAAPKGLVNPAVGQPGAPLLYARSNAAGSAFEPQRNLIHRGYALDGGGSVAADGDGHVYAAWHAFAAGGPGGEDRRGVWVARSADDGATFTEEQPAWKEPTGACGCCGLTIFSAPSNALFLLYRAATALIHRDMYLLESNDQGRSFRGANVHKWEISTCAMTSASLAASGSRVFGAWETAGQVFYGEVDAKAARIPQAVPAPGEGGTRKHPRLAVNGRGQVLLVWTEGTAWARGGSLSWQLFDAAGRPAGVTGLAPGVPIWSFAAPVARPDGTFVIYY
jgi:hypothetical protein